MYLRRLIKYVANLLTPIEGTVDMNKWERKNKALRCTKMNIGRNVAIGTGFECITGYEENITIDDYVALGHNVKFYNFGSIKIGSFTTFAADVAITNGGHDLTTLEPFSGEVKIGRGCWIGQGARIVRPVSIGDNVVIAAGAVVISDIPSGAVVAGVPARVVKYREVADKIWFLGNNYFCSKTFQLVHADVLERSHC
jgi:acetyltransferase-like isoleucine patch superfamily enzyme